MTLRHDLRCRSDIAARWCALAERRLEHLTEMFETGRWRRYHSEIAFLENIKEAKRVVQTWRALASPEDPPAEIAIAAAVPAWVARNAMPREPVETVRPNAWEIAAEAAIPIELPEPARPPALAEPATGVVRQPDSALEREIEFIFSLDGIEQRYPLLRNAF